MKHYRFLYNFLLVCAISAVVLGCDDEDGPPGTGTDFSGLASSYNEADGTKTVIIPLRNANASTASQINVSFDGTATEGEDFSLVGVTAEGVEISFIDDNVFEFTEYVRVRLTRDDGPLTGNDNHKVTIFSQCDDTEGLDNILSFLEHLEGVDGNIDGLNYPAEGNITIAKNEAGNYTITGLNVDFMQEIWGEEVIEQVPVVITLGASGAFTIEEQYIFTTLYNGAEYDYNIVGTGQIDPCSNAIIIDYEMIQDGFEVGAWLNANGYMTDPIFKATFELGL